MKTWKKKEWLLANGHIKEITRGRISLKNHELLNEAAANGVSFSDYTAPSVNEKGEKVVQVISNPADTPWYPSEDYRFPIKEYKAVAADGTEYTMREACNNCHLSLCGHICENPSVLGYPVKIVKA